MLYDFLAVKGNNWDKVNEDKLCGRQSEHKLKVKVKVNIEK